MIHKLTPEQLNISRVEQRSGTVKSDQIQTQKGKDFKSFLSDKIHESELKFSAHASKRLAMRGIELDDKDISSLKQAVDLAESKGSKDALVLHEKAAFVVSVKNRTVITAIDNMKDNIITNIDSAVIARDL
jgi:flagellar operon protein